MRYEIKGDTYPLRHCFPPFGLEWDEEDEVYWTDDEEGWREAVEALGRTPPDGARELTVTVDLIGKRLYPVGFTKPEGQPTHFMCSCDRCEIVQADRPFSHPCRWYELEKDLTDRKLEVRGVP